MRFLHQPVFSRIDRGKNTVFLDAARKNEKKHSVFKIICLILHLKTKRERKKTMALAIRPIPVLTGADAERFIEAAETAEKKPHTIELEISQEDFEKMMAKAILA